MRLLFGSLARYKPAWRGDVIAGLTVRAVLVPEALAYRADGAGDAVVYRTVAAAVEASRGGPPRAGGES
jgi:MFS superfamily sulfate permease-like transporter